MNEFHLDSNGELFHYQSTRLQNLISEMLQCCEDRKIFESQKFDLLYSEIRCLKLFRGQRYLTVKEIAQNLEVAKSRVTKILDGLSERGLIGSIDDPRDGRIKLISLTSQGEQRSKEIEDFERTIHGRILMNMAGEERKSVLSSLELLRSAMEAVKEQLI